MKFGICCEPATLPAVKPGEPLSSLPRLMDILLEAEADYLEFSAGTVMPESGEVGFEALRAALAQYPLRVEVFNCFLPPQHRVTGQEVDLAAVLDYCHTVLGRCATLGGAVMVLGSGGARRVPPGFDTARAQRQFVEFCHELAPIAEEAGIDIAIEPLNSKDDNLITIVADGAAIVNAVSHPRIRLLADLYHMAEESEDLGEVASAGHLLSHTHVADKGRLAPGFALDGEAEFTEFFINLRRGGYTQRPDARCSFEGHIKDLALEATPSLKLLRDRWEDAEHVECVENGVIASFCGEKVI
jgi:sugar phosphate isomerase/epimerase